MDNTVNHKQRSAVGRRPAGAHCLVTLALILSFIFFSISVASAATKTWITTTGTNNWFVGTNWSGAGVPGPTDDVVITNANTYSVLLTGSVAIADFYIGGGRAGTRALVFSNWNTTLTTTNVTVQNGGSITLPAAFTNNGISNNVYIVCSNLTVDAGGNINANAKGYAGGTSGSGGSGSGPGYGTANCGGGYGGHGSASVGGNTYGSFSAPVDAGSGGALGATYAPGGNGGGAIRIDASGTITNNGTISANGGNGGGTWAGGGSGGGIYLTCKTLSGTNSVFSVHGGNVSVSYGTYGGGGGGGRIASGAHIIRRQAPPRPMWVAAPLPVGTALTAPWSGDGSSRRGRFLVFDKASGSMQTGVPTAEELGFGGSEIFDRITGYPKRICGPVDLQYPQSCLSCPTPLFRIRPMACVHEVGAILTLRPDSGILSSANPLFRFGLNGRAPVPPEKRFSVSFGKDFDEPRATV
ncbi:MAG: hypothetical protein KKG09_06150 [Verrucomicrobia bacterium]|nr:hypothetical protein [Verrucomicrobiota bacterium]